MIYAQNNKPANTVESLGYTRYISNLSHGKMFDSIHIVATTTLLGTAIGAGCGSASGGLGAGPGAAIGAGVGFGIGVGLVLSRDLTEFSAYKSRLTKKGCEELSQIFLNNSERGLSCPISMNSMFDVPVSLETCKETFERKDLKDWVRKNGTCPITRKPIRLEDIKEDFSVYRINIDNIDSILRNKESLGQYTQVQIDGFILYKKHCQQRLKDYEKAEVENLLQRSKDGEIDLLAASKLLADLHHAKNGDPKK